MKLHTTPLLTLLALLLCCISLARCKKHHDPSKSGRLTQEITASAITAIAAHQAITVRYTQADGAPRVTLTCPDGMQDQLDVHVSGTTLVAAYRGGANVAERGVEVVVTAPAVGSFTATTAATIAIADGVNIAGDVTLSASTAGSIKAGSLKCQDLKVDATTSALIKVGSLDCYNLTGKASTAAVISIEGTTQTSTVSQDTGGEVRLPHVGGASHSTAPAREVKEEKAETAPAENEGKAE